jgi:hypothetical protein
MFLLLTVGIGQEVQKLKGETNTHSQQGYFNSRLSFLKE